MVRNKKGAWSFQQLGGIILVLLVVVAIAINFIPRIAKGPLPKTAKSLEGRLRLLNSFSSLLKLFILSLYGPTQNRTADYSV